MADDNKQVNGGTLSPFANTTKPTVETKAFSPTPPAAVELVKVRMRRRRDPRLPPSLKRATTVTSTSDGRVTGDLPHDKAAEGFWRSLAKGFPHVCGDAQIRSSEK